MLLCGLLAAAVMVPSARAQTAAPGTFSAQEQAQSLVARGVESFERGQIEQARLFLRDSLQHAETPEAHFWQGRIHATRAKSQPTEKLLAVASFRRALEMQPYGEEGELTRGWLLRLDGRPKTIRFVAASWNDDYDASATRDLIENVSSIARARGYTVIEAPRDELKMDRTSPVQLAPLCEGENGDLESGWLVCVNASSLDTKYSEPERKSKGGYRTSGTARMRLFDPLSKTLREPVSISDTEFSLLGLLGNALQESRSLAQQKAISRMGDSIWDKCGVVFGANRDVVMLDETSFPSSLGGVFGRATVPYDQAIALPRVALIGCTPPPNDRDEKGADAARFLNTQLQGALMEAGALAVISPGGMRAAMVATGAPAQHYDSGDVCRAALATGAQYALICNLTRFDVSARNQFIATKVTVRAQLQVMLLDAQTEELLLTRTYEEKQGAKKWLGGAAVGALVGKQNQVLQIVQQATTQDVMEIIVPGSVPPKAAIEKKVEKPKKPRKPKK